MFRAHLFPTIQSWKEFPKLLNEEVAKLQPCSIILEIGGGANPSLTPDQVAEYHYYIIDVSQEELNKAEGHHFTPILADITKDKVDIKADFIFSRMLLEHVPNPEQFHQAIYQMLNIGGRTLHFYATLYSPASVFNLLFPEALTSFILFKVQKRPQYNEGKFPAYYRWSKGPTKKQINRFESLGFEVILFNGYIGSGYLNRVPILGQMEKLYNKVILKFKNPLLCSNAIVLLGKQ